MKNWISITATYLVVLLLSVVFLVPNTAHATTVSYAIKAYTNSNTLVVSASGKYYQVGFSSGCSFPNYIVGWGGVSLSIDSNGNGPYLGASVIYYDGILSHNCSVTSTRTFVVTQFTLVDTLGVHSTNLVISNNGQYYQINTSGGDNGTSGGCDRLSSYVGESIAVETSSGVPMSGNIEFPNVDYSMSCNIESTKTLNLNAYTIEIKQINYTQTSLILNQGGAYYSVSFPSTSMDCNILGSDRTIMIDSSGLPAVGAIAYIPQPSYAFNCPVTASATVSTHKYHYVRNDSLTYSDPALFPGIVLGSVILNSEESGSDYYVYLSGYCDSILGTKETIYLDDGDGIADGLGSRILLYDAHQTCKIISKEIVQPPPPVVTPEVPSVTPVVVPVLPLLINEPAPTIKPGKVLGVTTTRPILKALKLTNGAYSYKLNGKKITFRPFGTSYKGMVWARSVDFGPDGKIYVFINSGAYSKGQIRVYKADGKPLKAYNPYGGFATNGLNATTVVEYDDNVYLSVGSAKAGTTVKSYQVTAKGLTTLKSVTATRTRGNVLVGFQKLYKDQYGLVTMRQNSRSTLKVWKLDFKTNKFIEDKKIQKSKIRI